MGRGARVRAERRNRRVSSVVGRKPKPWGTITAVVAILAFAGGVFGYAFAAIADKAEREAVLEPYAPTQDNPDPSARIRGVVEREYERTNHVSGDQRVAYDKTPPFGGPHDESWAACTGVVYDKAIRVENVLHSLEHGAVWVAYRPGKVSGASLDVLRARVDGEAHMLMSPVPSLDTPISLQAWGHQLKLDDANDERIDQFVKSLRKNRFTAPEAGSSCDELGPGRFDRDNPPPFDPAPPGPDALPVGPARAEQAGKGQADQHGDEHEEG